MAQIQGLALAKNVTITTTTSYELGDVRNFDEAVITFEVGGQSGTNPTLDIDVEMEHQRLMLGQGHSEEAYWTRVQTQNMGHIADAAGANTQTVGDWTYGAFTQVTNATTFKWVETRGLPQLLGERMRLTLRIGGTGSPTFTNVMLFVLLKAKGVETGAPF